MTSQIELKNIKFYAYHGVSSQETKVGNQFIINIILTAPLEKAVLSDELQDTINYAEVYSVVKREMEIPSRLLEHAAGRIMHALKKEFPSLQAIEIKLSKLNPPFGGDVESASVIITSSFD